MPKHKKKKKERKILMKQYYPCFHFTNDLGVYLLKSKERLDASTFFSLQFLLLAGKTFTIDFFLQMGTVQYKRHTAPRSGHVFLFLFPKTWKTKALKRKGYITCFLSITYIIDVITKPVSGMAAYFPNTMIVAVTNIARLIRLCPDHEFVILHVFMEKKIPVQICDWIMNLWWISLPW